jgi:tetratricopeptide (TPR) repeat protein
VHVRAPALRSLIPLLLALSLPTWVHSAPKRIAVLEFTNEADLTSFEVQTLADDVRAAALVLPRNGFIVMTRESMMAMLPPGTDLSKCSEARCEVEAGTLLGADLVVAGRVGRYAGDLVVVLKLFDTSSAALLEQRTVEGVNSKALRKDLVDEARALFQVLRAGALPGEPTQGIALSGSIGEQAEDWDFKRAKRYVLRFESEPDGALVEADGIVLCNTPCSKSLAKGIYQITMKKARHLTWEKEVRVSAEQVLRAKLDPAFAWLSVTSEPSNLAVEMSGQALGTTPIVAREVDPGSYSLLVKDERHYDAGERIVLRAGERKTVDIALKPKLGGLEVMAVDPSGNEVAGDVCVDGEQVGRAPWLGKVKVGEHVVRVTTNDGRTLEEQVSVALKQVRGVTFSLPRARREAPDETISVQAHPLGWARQYLKTVARIEMDGSTPAALANAGALWEALERYADAIKAYRKYIKLFSKKVDNIPTIELHMGKLYEAKKTPADDKKAIAEYEKYARKHKQGARVVEAWSRTGMLLFKADKKRNKNKVLKVFKGAMDAFTKLEAKEISAAAKFFAAQAAFISTEHVFNEFQAIKITATSTWKLKKLLKQKADLHQKLEKTYQSILDYKSLHWNAACLFRIGLLYYDFARSLIEVPLPDGLTPDQEDEYLYSLEVLAGPIQEKSMTAFAYALRLAHEKQIYNEWSRRAADYAAKVNPDKFPLKEEKMVTAGHVRSSFFLAGLTRDELNGVENNVVNALTRKPNDVIALSMLGQVLMNGEELSLARWVLEQKVLKEDPRSTEALNNLGVIYYRQGNIPAAFKYFAKAIEVAPDLVEARLNMAAILLNYLNYDGALAQYEAILALEPNRIEAMIGLASCQYGKRRFEEAIAQYEKAYSLDMSLSGLVERIGFIYEAYLNQIPTALEYYRRFMRLENTPETSDLASKVRLLEQLLRESQAGEQDPF